MTETILPWYLKIIYWLDRRAHGGLKALNVSWCKSTTRSVVIKNIGDLK